MDISIPGPSRSPSSSHNPLKRPSTRVANQPSVKRRKQIISRTTSEITVDNDEVFNTNLSAKAKETVLKLKKISDPFDLDLQDVVDGVFDHFDQNSGGDVDLAESALLLSSVTHVYTAQIKSLHDDVLAVANRLAGKEPPKGRQRKKNCENEATEAKTNEDNKTLPPNEAHKDGENGASAADATAEGADLSKSDDNTTDSATGGEALESTNTDEHSNGVPGEEVASMNPEVAEPLNLDASNENNLNDSGNAGDKQPDVSDGQQSSVEEDKKLESEILNEIPSRCTRRQSERLKNILNIEKVKERDYTLKKRKFDDDPPELISCVDEWNEILAYIKANGDVDVDEVLPPILEVQVGRKKKKVTINNNEVNDADADCEACNTANEVVEKTENEKMQSALRLAMASGMDGQQYETLDHLPNDVQERFHALIQEMHKLPFDYDYVEHDRVQAYHQKFLQAVSLLSQNSVLVKRTEKELEEKDVVAKVLEPNDSQMSESEQAISSVNELLNQVRQQASEEYQKKGKQSKYDAEVPVSQMIATLKRIICSRYKKWHVRTDGDRAVFKRIKEFEDRVKSVLKREAEQGLFDVKKYEMEVMDATLNESVGSETDELCPLSPILPSEGTGSPNPEDRNLSMSSSSRRSSIAGSVDGSTSWIRLYDIFSHMKKIDNSETCRHFYAVLALLSHKNLKINYDTLFSKESAKLITKLLKNRNENINKYPVGAKIMTSRCPDVDRDEVFLSPDFNSETIQHILEDGYLSSSGYQSDGQGSSSTSGNNGFTHSKSIQDAISEFVIDAGEPFPEELLSSRRKKY